MYFTPRLRKILLILLQEDKIMSVKKLADEIKVSKRTVQRELEYVGSSLNKYNVSLLTKPGIGIWVKGEESDKKKLYDLLKEEDNIDSGDKEDRRQRLILEILKDRTPKKLYYYADIFDVSEATISNDMEALENWFNQFHLNIIRKQGYGVSLEGSEKNYRLAVRKFIDENMDSKLIKDFNDIFNRVCLCFERIHDKRLGRLTENSYNGLILYVTIAVNRILQKEIIEPNEELSASLVKNEEYHLAILI